MTRRRLRKAKGLQRTRLKGELGISNRKIEKVTEKVLRKHRAEIKRILDLLERRGADSKVIELTGETTIERKAISLALRDALNKFDVTSKSKRAACTKCFRKRLGCRFTKSLPQALMPWLQKSFHFIEPSDMVFIGFSTKDTMNTAKSL